MPNHHHRSGGLKQANKKNKRNRASKRSVTRAAGGKVEGRRGQFKQRLLAHNKADRRHIQQQRRDAKRQELLRQKRGLDGGPAPPKIVGIISLGESEGIEEKLRSLIAEQADRVMKTFGDGNNSTMTLKFETHKKDGNLTILTNSTAFRSHYDNGDSEYAAVMSALDLCRVCDVILFVVDGNEDKGVTPFVGMNVGVDDRSLSTSKSTSTAADFDHIISERGDRILTAVKGQGLPRVATVLAKTKKEEEPGEDDMTTQSTKSIRRANHKRRTDLKKYVSRFATTEFGVDNDKTMEVNLVDTSSEGEMEEEGSTPEIDPEEHLKKTLAAALVRGLCCISGAPAKWVSQLPRAYMLSDSHSYDPEKQELRVTGYVRGRVPFDSNSAIHIPNLGTYGCKSIVRARQPNCSSKMEISEDIIEVDPMKRESLEKFATPDALDGEQNLVGFDEKDEEFYDAGDSPEDADEFARPAGWSDYQSAWLDAVDEDGINADFDHGELAKELNKKSSESVAANTMDLDDANRISEEERKALEEQRRKEQKEHQEFPDEVQVEEDEKARDRFARYRSLKSFRQSPWDAKENLPDSYASIFHFSSFKATQQAVMGEMRDLAKAANASGGNFWNGENKTDDMSGDIDMDDDDDMLKGCVPSGSYITVTLEDVNSDAYGAIAPGALLSAVTLMPHEGKVSVLHMGLSHSNNCEATNETPVKSKDVLTFRCGWRTWTGRPVFSQNNLNCDKHKFERFLPQSGSFFAASVFGPVTYTPCPILVFRDLDGRRQLIATGSMISADADRIVVKRIILTGYPVRVHKRFATVKYMFYDPEDVKWFKPAGLITKHGLNGKIEQSVGEHGTMKCLFNAPIKQHDTVCLPLYKRIYPKFASAQTGSEEGTIKSMRQDNSSLIVK
ncbi:unnamed protein product [Cylindrotheca closterium]|uniref:Ribosome biogenesis protein BMS1/TSR1 C-terminal domain-containing protein n=1 Tax=Cylindrotheca closterium TaxID=2856 RepID=A0AAD2GCC0_9STRA|nr:unnamed protein product [Cylindrotheca closterium]